MFDLHVIKDLGGKLMGRHFVFRVQTLLHFKPILVCVLSLLCCVTQATFLSLPTRLWVSLRLLSWERGGISAVRCFSGPSFPLFFFLLCFNVCYTCLCSTCFVEVGSFPKLYASVFAWPQMLTNDWEENELCWLTYFHHVTRCHSAPYAWQMHKWIDMWSYCEGCAFVLLFFFQWHPQGYTEALVFPTVNYFISCTHALSHIPK